MNIHLPFPVPGNRKDRAARRRSKSPAHPPPPVLEALEELTVPSALAGALPALSVPWPAGPALTAPLALVGAPARGALPIPGGIPAQISSSHSLQAPLVAPSKVLSALARIPAQVSSSQSLQAPLRASSKVLSTLANELHQGAVQLSGITSSALRGTVRQLATAVSGPIRAAERTLGQQLSLTGGGIAPLIEILSNRATALGAGPSNLSTFAGSATANTAHQLNSIVTRVTGDLNKAAATLPALSSIQSGTTTDLPLLAGVLTDVASTVSRIVTSLNALVAVLPDLIGHAMSHARQYLHSALLDLRDSLGAISGTLDTIADQLIEVLGSLPGDGPTASAADDRSTSPPSSSSSGGVLAEFSDTLSTIAKLLSTLGGGLSAVVAGGSGRSSSASSARQVIDLIFSGVA